MLFVTLTLITFEDFVLFLCMLVERFVMVLMKLVAREKAKGALMHFGKYDIRVLLSVCWMDDGQTKF